MAGGKAGASKAAGSGGKPAGEAERVRVLDVRFEMLDNLRHRGAVIATVAAGGSHAETAESKIVEGRSVFQAWARVRLEPGTNEAQITVRGAGQASIPCPGLHDAVGAALPG